MFEVRSERYHEDGRGVFHVKSVYLFGLCVFRYKTQLTVTYKDAKPSELPQC